MTREGNVLGARPPGNIYSIKINFGFSINSNISTADQRWLLVEFNFFRPPCFCFFLRCTGYFSGKVACILKYDERCN